MFPPHQQQHVSKYKKSRKQDTLSMQSFILHVSEVSLAVSPGPHELLHANVAQSHPIRGHSASRAGVASQFQLAVASSELGGNRVKTRHTQPAATSGSTVPLTGQDPASPHFLSSHQQNDTVALAQPVCSLLVGRQATDLCWRPSSSPRL